MVSGGKVAKESQANELCVLDAWNRGYILLLRQSVSLSFTIPLTVFIMQQFVYKIMQFLHVKLANQSVCVFTMLAGIIVHGIIL